VTEESAPVQIGDVLDGKFRVDRVLGAGGMGVVVAATHLDLHEVRAVKYMLPRERNHAKLVERFLREARASVKLKSAHVVRVYDVGRFQSGEPYMVMEYLDGHDLQAVAKGNDALDPAVVVDYVLQALDAVAEAHRIGIIHRDLKPANLFLARDEHGAETVKVLDFGISKLTGEMARGQGLDMTKTATMLGSPYFMSPEQMRSSKDVDRRTDIWSIGVILYQLLTGELPFVGDSITALCGSVFTEEPTRLNVRRAELPAGLDAVVMRCLEKSPGQRYESAAALAAALAPFGGPSAHMRVQQVARHSSPTSSGPFAGSSATGPDSVPTPMPDMHGTAAAFAKSTGGPNTGGVGAAGATKRSGAVAIAGVLVLALAGIGVAVGVTRALKDSERPLKENATSPETDASEPASASATISVSAPASATASISASTAVSATVSTAASASATARVPRPRPRPTVQRQEPKDPFGPGRE